MILWRQLHNIFGWDYIAWGYLLSDGVARVYVDGEGNPYYWKYRDKSGLVKITLENYNKLTWLTCRPEKYLKGIEENERTVRGRSDGGDKKAEGEVQEH